MSCPRFASGVACVALALCASCEGEVSSARFKDGLRLGGADVSAEVLNNGASLYGRYCASCHGVDGDGKGPAAGALAGPPRDFREARFRYASASPELLPTQDELISIIERGVPERGMPGWKGLRDEDLSALAFYIKTFSARWRGDAGASPQTSK